MMGLNLFELASVHLGKAGDGTAVKPYVTPDEVDPSLLVPIPRSINRADYDIKDMDFYGNDVWNCYETSFLLDSGFPVSGVLVISYPSDSPNIVESKSLKLYLNSFNMMKMGPDSYVARGNFITTVKHHLTNCIFRTVGVGGYPTVTVRFFINSQTPESVYPFKTQFISLENIVDVSGVKFDNFNEDASILQTLTRIPSESQHFHSCSLRSNCRVTNQPDWGDVYVYIKGNRLVTPESLLQYIVSMRKENHFHEEICEMMYKRLSEKLDPDELMVACLYTRRGGIDINPIRASNTSVYSKLVNMNGLMFNKTMRQ